MRAAGICWVAPGKPPLVARLCGYNRDRANPTTTAAPEWPPRAAVWHETRTRAAGMHAEYDWPCYAAQLRRCPRVSARLGVPPGLLLCRQPENLSVRLVSRRFLCEGGAPHQRAPLRSHGLLPPHRGTSFKIVSGGCGLLVGCISIILGRSSIIERRC